jgi:hypothetical protein
MNRHLSAEMFANHEKRLFMSLKNDKWAPLASFSIRESQKTVEGFMKIGDTKELGSAGVLAMKEPAEEVHEKIRDGPLGQLAKLVR